MAPQIFVLGVTGYIGFQAVFHVANKYPDYTITALVRNEEQASRIKAVLPNLKFVFGDLDSTAVLLEECRKADIVLQCASADHPASAKTIIAGMKLGSTSTGYLIHTSGAGILGDVAAGFGNYTTDVYDDIADIKALASLSIERAHRDVDEIVLSAADNHVNGERYVKTAIICPPTIYGTGDGPLKKRSIQLPELVRVALIRGSSFTVHGSNNRWRNVHIADLGDAYTILVEQAVDNGGKAAWGAEGYYFAENGEHSFRDLSERVADVAFNKGYIVSKTVEDLSVEEVTQIIPIGPRMWGLNSIGIASRIRKLGWVPSRPGINEFIAEAVEFEAAALLSKDPSIFSGRNANK